MRGLRKCSFSCTRESVRWVYEAKPGEGDERDDPDFGRPKSVRQGAKSLIDEVVSFAST
jgi:hypothetical protein